jgi:ABC-type glycerol-3-phosphate transport system substrate-binding protein
MMISGDWMFSLYQTIEDFDWDVASIPEGPGGKWCYGASNTLGIPKDGQHVEESWGFLKFFVWDKDAQLISGTSVGPALIDAALDEEFIALKQGERGPNLDNVRWAFEQMHENTTAEYYNMTRNSQQWNPVFADMDSSLMTLCDRDPAEALAEAAVEITEIIRKEPGEV